MRAKRKIDDHAPPAGSFDVRRSCGAAIFITVRPSSHYRSGLYSSKDKVCHLDKNNAFRLKFSCRPRQVHLLDTQFLRLFWGEQPPFASFRAWGAVLPCDDGAAILLPTLQLATGLHHSRPEYDCRWDLRP